MPSTSIAKRRPTTTSTTTSVYARIKVLTEKGKELATVRTPYEHRNFKVTDIQGRTIHPDGTVIPLTAKPSDLMDVKTKRFPGQHHGLHAAQRRGRQHSGVQLQIRYDDNTVSSPDWDVQQPYFVHKAHYAFLPAKEQRLRSRIAAATLLNRLMYGSIGGIGDKVSHQITAATTSISPIFRHSHRRLDAATEQR